MMGGDIMEVVMSGGDGSMNEDTLTQVVNMLQMEGQLTQGNHTIIIRHPGSDDVQMIQAVQSDGELILTKASAAEVQALQSRGALNNLSQELVDNSSGPVVMVDEGGNIVEGNLGNVVQIPSSDGQEVTQEQLITTEAVNGATVNGQTGKSHEDVSDILSNLVEPSGNTITAVSQQNMVVTAAETPTTITTHTNLSHMETDGEAYSIKIDTGGSKTRAFRDVKNPAAIVIATTTGKSKYHPPKFHKCEACVINFVSKIAYMNHMETCPNKKKAVGKGVVTYTCVFCETKFATRLSLMQHVRTCDKAKSTKPNSNHKIKSSESKAGIIPKSAKMYNELNNRMKKPVGMKQKSFFKAKKEVIVEEDIDNLLEERDMDSDEEDEKNIVYDDDEDINQELLADENVEEPVVPRKSRKCLGPIVSKGMLKCRDCNRTFSKETQYNRHVNACTMRPLLGGKFADDDNQQNDGVTATPNTFDMKRKREDSDADQRSPKRLNLGPKIVSVDPKKVVAASMKSKPPLQNDSPKNTKIAGGSISKIVKITQSDPLLKKGKTISKPKTIPIGPLCGLCGEKSKSMEDLGLHMKHSHSEDILNLRDSLDGKGFISSIKCALCGVFFAQLHDYMLHLVGAHSSNLNEAQEELLGLGLNLPCAFCQMVLPSQPSLLEHISLAHLNMIADMPSSQSSTSDVDPLLKEKPQELEAELQESVTCPECGIRALSSFFDHHQCVAQKSKSTQKPFLCCHDSCTDSSFFKLSHLLMHLVQVHEKSAPCQNEQFETSTNFFDWLKEEEHQIKKKYTKSVQRIQAGKLTTVWTCHRFHNSMMQNSTANEELNRHKLCYSRIHAVTDFNPATSRYDGETAVKYYPEHVHVAKPKKSVPKVVSKTETPAEKPSSLLSPSKTIETPVTTEAELNKLLETGENDPPPSTEISKPVPEVQQSDLLNTDSHPENADILSELTALQAEYPSDQDASKTRDTEESSKDSGSLVPMSDDEMLKKMLGETLDTPPAVVEETPAPKVEEKVSEESKPENSQLMPAEAKISEDDMLEAFGVDSAADIGDCLPSESSSASPSVPVETPSESQMSADGSIQTPEDKAQEEEGDIEESTYVLPADLEEWKKLFELVRTQIETNSLSPEGLTQAQELLPFEDKIATIPIEKQVDVFARLCTLANVSMS